VEGVLTIIWFLVALGVLVTFHEFGHFYIARRCGVKVIRFSVGFGKPLWTWRDKLGTEYTLAGIPLGGFVKMLDEREGDVPPHLLDQAFTQKTVWQRIAIVAAGPIANFILAILLFWIMLLPGTTDVAPIVDEVAPNSVAAEAGLEPGQEILSVDGVETPTWQGFTQQLLSRLGETGVITFTAKYQDSTLVYESQARLDQWLKDVEEPDPIRGLGLELFTPAFDSLVAQVSVASPAEAAGIKRGDLLISADGESLDGWMSWVEYVRARPEQAIELRYQRNGIDHVTVITPQRIEEEDGTIIGRVGVAPEPPTWPEEFIRTQEYSIAGALMGSLQKTWDTTGFVLLSIKKLFVGEISTKNLSGPITIAKVAGASAKAGMNYYIGFLALLSISLGVFNLLPIPVLDGGHLFYYLIEVVKGSPVSEEVQIIGFRIGMSVVMGLMALALYNDIMRL